MRLKKEDRFCEGCGVELGTRSDQVPGAVGIRVLICIECVAENANYRGEIEDADSIAAMWGV